VSLSRRPALRHILLQIHQTRHSLILLTIKILNIQHHQPLLHPQTLLLQTMELTNHHETHHSNINPGPSHRPNSNPALKQLHLRISQILEGKPNPFDRQLRGTA
jgi:hypothetical protein